MAIDTQLDDITSRKKVIPRKNVWEQATSLLKSLASLKLTVALFALSVFLVLVGTLAQTEADIWDVVSQYFRCWFAWVEFRVFLPPAWSASIPRNPNVFPFNGSGFWYPGGWTIGTLMTLNLLAAHSLRFTAQSAGTRLWAGISVIILGLISTWLVIATGSMGEGRLQGNAFLNGTLVWNLFQYTLLGTGVFSIIAATRTPSKKVGELWLYGTLGILLSAAGIWLVINPNLKIDDSGMRILWQLLKGTGASILLLTGCWLVFRKRAGIVLLHAGVLLLMFNEINVYTNHVESQLRLEEGQTSNYTEDIRSYELAFVDSSDEAVNKEVVVPKDIFESTSTTIVHPDLPFEIKPIRYMQNSDVRELKDSETPLATQGQGLKITVDEIAPITGVQSKSVDAPSLVAELFDPKTHESLGVWLFCLFTKDQKITLGDKSYDASLRFQRYYKDFSVHLIDVERDDYIGTDTPRNYSSDVQIVDLKTGATRQAHIWMNNPLRYAGETFYQSQYQPIDASRGLFKEATVLSVTTNEGWMIPYVACMIVAIGMLAQFLITLSRFLNRQTSNVTQPQTPSGTDIPSSVQHKRKPSSTHDWGQLVGIFVTTILIAGMGGYLLSKMRPPQPKPDQIDLVSFGQIPIVYEGRTKPLDTLARNSMRLLNQRETAQRPIELKKDDEGNIIPGGVIDGEYDDVKTTTISASQWLLDLISRPDIADHDRIIKIDHEEVLALLKLPRRKKHLYSYYEITQEKVAFDAEIDQARKVDTLNRSPYQRKLIDVYSRLNTVLMLQITFSPPNLNANPDKIWEEIAQAIGVLKQFESNNPPLVIPPAEIDWNQIEANWKSHQLLSVIYPLIENKDLKWMTFQRSWLANLLVTWSTEVTGNPFSDQFIKIIVAAGDLGLEDVDQTQAIAAFNKSVADYHQLLADLKPSDYDPQKVNFEATFNAASPFYYSGVNYLVALICVLLSWVGYQSLTVHRSFNRAATGILLITFFVHIGALLARMYISGRPPVTNLYSSAIFIGWAGVLAGILLERILKHGLGNFIAAVAGFATILIADGMWFSGGLASSGSGDTMTVLQAVLDTQFWLATHVVCITLGYAATFVAGLLGAVYILRGLFTNTLDRQSAKELITTTYGALCFALFFSFVGTVLGGLWADDSWGRFWGWDPKENGALIIVLWNALVLHARWDGMAKNKGLALLAVAGNITTCWSWFGVNELGVGLHSYGFTEGVLMYLGLFVLSQLVIIILGLIPTSLWASSQQLNPSPK